MPTQAIKPDIPDAFNNQMYTTPSPNKEAMKAILPTIDVTINALTGTPRYLIYQETLVPSLGELNPKAYELMHTYRVTSR